MNVRPIPGTLPVLVGTLVWLLAAILAGALGLVQRLRPPAPQLVLLALTTLLLVAILAVPLLRRWALTVDVRVLVALHLSRFVGVYFLVLYAQGVLPYAFAVPGGWGDIIVAVLAAAVLAAAPRTGVKGWRVYFAWNALGLLDILLVVATATRLAMADPTSMQALLRLPLSLLPTFLVPLIIASHVVLFVRLWKSRAAHYTLV